MYIRALTHSLYKYKHKNVIFDQNYITSFLENIICSPWYPEAMKSQTNNSIYIYIYIYDEPNIHSFYNRIPY